jgi:phosphatidylglycerol:prolipoprotein diacylglycerol transferase
MYPILFRIGSFEITSFGAMVALGALLGILLLRRELGRSGLNQADGTDAAMVGVLGGLVGAKLLFVFEHASEGVAAALFNRGGLSWFGGLIGGVLAGWLYMRWRRLPALGVLAAAAPGLALGHAVGRIGCFLVGDDYGRPTHLPWGVSFPQGLPPTFERVHPTQIYEAIFLFIFMFVLIRWRKRGMADLKVIALYLLIAGAERFLLEFVRINVRVALGLTVAQWAALAAVVLGGVLLMAAGKPPAAATHSRAKARSGHV